jgi:hypothetical protein
VAETLTLHESEGASSHLETSVLGGASHASADLEAPECTSDDEGDDKTREAPDPSSLDEGN